mgnify:CR=1 FL=1
MSTRNFLEEFKFQLFSSTMTNRLVIVNVLVFFFFQAEAGIRDNER